MNRTAGRLTAISLGTLAAGVIFGAAAVGFTPITVWDLPVLAKWVLSGYSIPRYGFEARFDLPRTRPDDRCGTNNGGLTHTDWIDGPHEGFAVIGPDELAHDSIDWFEHSLESGAWDGNETARLLLVYPSEGRSVRACYDAELDLAWAEQLEAWFAWLPPAPDTRASELDRPYSWTLDFGDRGRVREYVESEEAALAALRTYAERPVSTKFPGEPSLALGYSERRSPNSYDVYSVQVDRVEDVGELSQLLSDKRGL